jgi:hypothetical protein
VGRLFLAVGAPDLMDELCLYIRWLMMPLHRSKPHFFQVHFIF